MMGKKIIIQFLLSGLTGLLAFISLSLSARFFGPEIIGQITYLTGLLGFCFAFSDLGLSRSHVHFTAYYQAKEKTVAALLYLKLPLILLCGLAAVILGIFSRQFSLIFLILIFNEIFTRVADSLLITFEGEEKALPQNLLRLFTKVIKLFTVIVLGLMLKETLGYSLTFFFEALLVLLGSFWLTRHFWPLKFHRPLIHDYLRYSLPFALIMPLGYFQESGLILMIKKFWPAQELGYYSAALGLFGFLKMFSSSLIVFFFPAISRLFSQKNYPAIQRYTDLAVKFSVILLLPILSVLYLLKLPLINLILGARFSPAAPIFGWLLIGVFILAIFAPYDYVLYATRNHRSIIWINLLTSGLVLGLGWLLMPHLGAEGAVIASLTGWLSGGLIQFAVLHQKTGIKFCRDFSFGRKEVKYIYVLFHSFSQTTLRSA